MSYNLTKTNGDLLVTVLDGTTTGTTTADSFSLIFIGKNYPNYGQIEQRNFLRLLENGANNTSPLDNGITPLAGELWFDTANKKLNVFDGSQFKPVAGVTSASAPLNPAVGDFWWHSTETKLKIWNGTDWTVIGPSYEQVGGLTGTVLESIADVDDVEHKVSTIYTQNKRTAIISQDTAFAPKTALSGYSVIRPGVNFGFNTGTGFTVTQTGSNTEIINDAINGSLRILANIAAVPTVALTVNGTTGLITVLGDPTQSMGVATKSYVDTSISALNSYTQNSIGVLTGNVATLFSNAAVQAASLASLNTVKANLASPALTGEPTAPTASAGTATTQIATTAFVGTAVNTANVGLKGYSEAYATARAGAVNTALIANVATINANIGTLIANDASQATSISSLSVIKANLDSPALTGVPTAPTAPTATANTQVATTAFVNTAVATSSYALWKGSNKYVSSLPPGTNDGANGDIWFQI